MNRVFLITVVGVGIRVLQNTLLGFLAIRGVQPDLVLVLTSFAAFRFGRQEGQVTGFLIGIAEDAVGATPFGFHSVVRLVHGNIAGVFHGSISLDPVVVPCFVVIVSFAVKTAMVAAMTFVFGLGDTINPIWTGATLIEAGYTVVVAPLIFGILRRFGL